MPGHIKCIRYSMFLAPDISVDISFYNVESPDYI